MENDTKQYFSIYIVFLTTIEHKMFFQLSTIKITIQVRIITFLLYLFNKSVLGFNSILCVLLNKYLFENLIKWLSHFMSSDQIAEPDLFRFGSNFAHVFISPKWEILKIFGPLDPFSSPFEGYFNNLARKNSFTKKNVKFVISEACDPQKIPNNI